MEVKPGDGLSPTSPLMLDDDQDGPTGLKRKAGRGRTKISSPPPTKNGNTSSSLCIVIRRVLASAIIPASIAWAGAFDGIGFHRQKGRFVNNWSEIPTAISLHAFCYYAHLVFPTLYTSTENKNQFTNVLVVCFSICTITYASMGVIGHLMFGSVVQIQITLNLPTEKVSSKVAICTTLITPLAKYALMVTPITDAIKMPLPNYLKINRFVGMIIGTTILINSVIVTLMIPFFLSLMAFVGAFLSITDSIILPCLCYMKISGTNQIFEWEMVILVSIIVMGFAIAVLGTYISVVEIVSNMQV